MRTAHPQGHVPVLGANELFAARTSGRKHWLLFFACLLILAGVLVMLYFAAIHDQGGGALAEQVETYLRNHYALLLVIAGIAVMLALSLFGFLQAARADEAKRHLHLLLGEIQKTRREAKEAHERLELSRRQHEQAYDELNRFNQEFGNREKQARYTLAHLLRELDEREKLLNEKYERFNGELGENGRQNRLNAGNVHAQVQQNGNLKATQSAPRGLVKVAAPTPEARVKLAAPETPAPMIKVKLANDGKVSLKAGALQPGQPQTPPVTVPEYHENLRSAENTVSPKAQAACETPSEAAADPAETSRLLIKAAENGDLEAMLKVAKRYLYGAGLPADSLAAYSYLLLYKSFMPGDDAKIASLMAKISTLFDQRQILEAKSRAVRIWKKISGAS